MTQKKTDFPPIPRLRGEPEKWYLRFVSYCAAGVGRSAMAIYKAERPDKALKGPVSIPGAWKLSISKYRWKARVARFDARLVGMQRAEIGRKWTQEREKRFNALRAFGKKIRQSLILFSPMNQPLQGLAAAIRAYSEMSRAEYDLIELEQHISELEDRSRKENYDRKESFGERIRSEFQRVNNNAESA